MSNIFDQVAQKWRNSPFVVWVMFVTMGLFAIGVLFFIEDTISSRNGIALLELVFGIKPVNIPIAYWAMSLAPQFVQIVFMYAFLVNPKKNWWLLAIIAVFFTMDFMSDVQDRSNQHLFPLTGGVNLDSTTFVASFLTIMFYTIGSEVFLSISVGLMLVLLADSIRQFGILWVDIGKAFDDTRSKMEARRNVLYGRNQPQQQQQHSQRRN